MRLVETNNKDMEERINHPWIKKLKEKEEES